MKAAVVKVHVVWWIKKFHCSALDINNSPNLDFLEQGKNVGIVHSKTSIGCACANCLRPVCPMDAIGPVAKDQDSDAKRIVWAGLYKSGKLGIVFSDMWRRRPIGIADFSGDPCLARPLASLPAYSNGEGNNVILAPHVEQLPQYALCRGYPASPS
jgi:hypothetical protein